ncbi:MAG: hypothetical protein ACREI7_00100 [Myxococcota bacterium]
MTSKKILRAALGLIVAIALSLVGSPAWVPAAHAVPGCDASDLSGTYAFVVHGTNPSGQPFGAIGTFTADGAGNLDGFRISVDDGVYATSDFTCTYSMSASCAFRGPCVDDGEVVPEVQLDGVLADGKKEIVLAMSGIPSGAGGPVVTGVANKQ